MTMSNCRHTLQQGKAGETGTWCCQCGLKVDEVEKRECKDCEHHRAILGGSVCKKHLMRVTADMHVTYLISEGTCFTEKISANLKEAP